MGVQREGRTSEEEGRTCVKEAGNGDCLANMYQVNLFYQETKQTIIIY